MKLNYYTFIFLIIFNTQLIAKEIYLQCYNFDIVENRKITNLWLINPSSKKCRLKTEYYEKIFFIQIQKSDFIRCFDYSENFQVQYFDFIKIKNEWTSKYIEKEYLYEEIITQNCKILKSY